MSKTAVIISAHMRSFERCFPTIAWHVLRHYQNCDFFVSTVRDRDVASVNLIEQRFPDSRVVIEVCDAQPELPIPVQPHDPKWLPMTGQMFSHEPYAISVHPQAVLRQLWHLQRGWEFFNQRACAADYDVFIRLRPDSYFRAFSPPSETHMLQAYTPFWGTFGGCNDRFAIMGEHAARAYFTTFGQLGTLLKLGCPLHPESLVHASLWHANVDHRQTLRAIFSKLIWDHGPDHKKFRDPEILNWEPTFYRLSQ